MKRQKLIDTPGLPSTKARRQNRRAFFYHAKSAFRGFAERSSSWCSSPAAFIAALGIVGIWAITGPIFHYSNTWLMAANTGMTVITFLLVFLIQNSQHRDTKAIHIKLAELIRATEGAHTMLVDLEKLTDEELTLIRNKYSVIAEQSREHLRSGRGDTHIPDVELEP